MIWESPALDVLLGCSVLLAIGHVPRQEHMQGPGLENMSGHTVE